MRTPFVAMLATALLLLAMLFLGLRWFDPRPGPELANAARSAEEVESDRSSDTEAMPAPIADRQAVESTEITTPDASASDASAARNPLALSPVELHVVDGTTGIDLHDVQVLRLGGRRSPEGPVEEVGPRLLGGDSPLSIPIPEKAKLENYWVEAPGYSREQIGLDFVVGGEREVVLWPAGTLRVFVDVPPGKDVLSAELRSLEVSRELLSGAAQLGEEYARTLGRDPSLHTRRRAEGARRVAAYLEHHDPKDEAVVASAGSLVDPDRRRTAPRGEWMVFEHLAVGDWLVSLTRGKQGRSPLAFTIATVEARQVVERTLRIEEAPPVAEGVVSGTIELPSEWNVDARTAEPSELVLQGVDVGPERDGEIRNGRAEVREFTPRGGGTFSWSAGMLAPGTYVAFLPQYAFVQEFELKEGESAKWDLLVPPPCSVRLRVIDPLDGEEIEQVQEIWVWSGGGDPGHGSSPITREDDAPFEFRAPQGRVHVRLGLADDRYFLTESSLEVGPGENERTIELGRRGDLRIHLREGSGEIPWHESFRVQVTPRDGHGGFAGWENHGFRDFRLVFVPAATYRLIVEGVPGFQPSAPFEVELKPGEVVDVEVPLRRKAR